MRRAAECLIAAVFFLVLDLGSQTTPGGTASLLARAQAKSPPLEPEKNERITLGKLITNTISMKLAYIPPGAFTMGSPLSEQEQFKNDNVDDFAAQETQHEVAITKGFYMGAYAVTQKEYEKVMGKNPSFFSATGKGKEKVAGLDTHRFPVEWVSWDDALLFLVALNKRAKESEWVYRLPTEVEWEYACRGGPLSQKEDSAFDFYLAKPTNQLRPDQTNFGSQHTCKVGSYEPNRLGLYDMHGNVWEWCDDRDVDAYGLLHQSKGDSLRVERGGCWHDGPGPFRYTSARISFPASYRNNDHGFRVARIRSEKKIK